MTSSEDEDDFFSSDEGGEDEELAKRAVSGHLSFHLWSQEMHAAWWSEDCWKVGNDVLELAGLPAVPLFFPCLLREETVLQTPGLQVLHHV